MNEGMKIQTRSGIFIDPFNPHPSEIKLNDIVNALFKICRFAGQCSEFYDVGTHSINVQRYLSAQGYGARIQLLGVIHDSTEAYFIDLPKPIKMRLPDYVSAENHMMDVIYEALDIPPHTEEEHHIIKVADDQVFIMENRWLMKHPSSNKSNELAAVPNGFEFAKHLTPQDFIRTYKRLLVALTKEEAATVAQ